MATNTTTTAGSCNDCGSPHQGFHIGGCPKLPDTIIARPKKLRDGSWGAIADTSKVRAGDVVTIQTRAGKTWTAEVSKVVWKGNGAAILATGSDPAARRSAPARRAPAGRRRSGSGRGQAARVAGFSGFCTDNASCGCFDCA